MFNVLKKYNIICNNYLVGARGVVRWLLYIKGIISTVDRRLINVVLCNLNPPPPPPPPIKHGIDPSFTFHIVFTVLYKVFLVMLYVYDSFTILWSHFILVDTLYGRTYTMDHTCRVFDEGS